MQAPERYEPLPGSILRNAKHPAVLALVGWRRDCWKARDRQEKRRGNNVSSAVFSWRACLRLADGLGKNQSLGWVTLSNRAVVILLSPKTCGHSPKVTLVVMIPLTRVRKEVGEMLAL